MRGTHVLQLAAVTGADTDVYASRRQRMGRVRVCVRGREGARERKGKRERARGSRPVGRSEAADARMGKQTVTITSHKDFFLGRGRKLCD